MRLKTIVFNVFRRFFLLPFAEKWLVKRVLRSHSKHWLRKLAPNHYQYAAQATRTVTRDGVTFQLKLSDYVHWRVYWDAEKSGKNALFAKLKPGDSFVDVGANIGEICLKASEIVGDSGMVWAFEPIEQSMRHLKQNLALNPQLAARMYLFPYALGAQDAESISFVHPRKDNFGMIRIQSEAHAASIFASVPMHKLDDVLSGKQIDGIKIDVEGYELQVLRGADRLIQQYHPWLFIEVDDTNLQEQGDSAAALLAWLEERGYRIRWVTGDRRSHGDVMAVWEN